ncbi:MAG: hypothetical protein HY332_01515 [Chloroflexi bacterium]|nr:hypothetical protein [Chloroflexota bacterium]
MVPYGIYDLTHHRGAVHVRTSADTPRFTKETRSQPATASSR